jgi:hypothetical protein
VLIFKLDRHQNLRWCVESEARLGHARGPAAPRRPRRAHGQQQRPRVRVGRTSAWPRRVIDVVVDRAVSGGWTWPFWADRCPKARSHAGARIALGVHR